MRNPTKGFTAVMAQRREPPDALDYFPTPVARQRYVGCSTSLLANDNGEDVRSDVK